MLLLLTEVIYRKATNKEGNPCLELKRGNEFLVDRDLILRAEPSELGVTDVDILVLDKDAPLGYHTEPHAVFESLKYIMSGDERDKVVKEPKRIKVEDMNY